MQKRRSTLPLLSLFLIGCAFTPSNEQKTALSSKAADTALTMIGKPYRYGGHTPNGFDCSGLVYYSYKSAGIEVPRDTRGQRNYGASVSSKSLKKGDLLFFNLQGKRFSHVAVYLGDQTFVHAPSTGKMVRTDSLTDPFWRKYFVGARRL